MPRANEVEKVKRSEATSPRTGFGSQIFARLARPLARWRGVDVQLALIAAGLWVATQWYGATVASDEWYDALALVAIGVAAWRLIGRDAATFPILRDRMAVIVSDTTQRLGRAARRAWPRIGVDLVTDPPYPRGLPSVFLVPGAAISVLGLLFLARPWGSGLEFIADARSYAYPVYLALAATYWAIAVAVGVFGLALPFAMIWNYACATYRSHDARREEVTRRGMTSALVLIAAAMVLIPAWAVAPIAALLCAATVGCLYLPTQPRLSVIWRPRQSDGPHRSVEWRALQSIETLVLTGICTVVMTVPGITPLSEAHWDAAPVSACVRWLAAFGGLFLTLTLGIYRIHFSLAVTLVAPSRAVPRRIRVEGGSLQERSDAVKTLSAEGFRTLASVADEKKAYSDDVLLRLDSDAPVESPLFTDLAQPIAPKSLDDTEILWRLKRRADLRSRRNLMKGTEAVFKEAAAALKGPGKGFIFAPHQWFMLGLARDVADHDTTEDRSVEGFLNPEYRAVMSPRARHHFYLVMNAVGVDLIYVEDGVGYRRLQRALRVMFEIFDKHGVDRRVSSRDFSAVHGVHVILHDVTPESPRVSETYPEPDYESDTRARILHLYRDRGGDEQLNDSPVELDDVPLLV